MPATLVILGGPGHGKTGVAGLVKREAAAGSLAALSLVDRPADADGAKDGVVAWIKESGGQGLDGAIVVVSAADGTVVALRNQLAALNAVKAVGVVLFLNKVDLVEDEDLLEMVDMEVEGLLEQYSNLHLVRFRNKPAVRGSVQLGTGFSDLVGALKDAFTL